MSSASPREDHPLELTVHSMPQPAQVAAAAADRTRGGRWKMIVLFLVCAAPVAASYFTYYVWRPEGRRNFGALVEPQRPLPEWSATALDGSAVKMQTLKDQWLLISVAPGDCDASCARHLYLQHQLREGLGKEKERLDWVWLVSDNAPISDALRPALKDATVLRVAPDLLAQWLAPQSGHALQEHLYLVDPLGNWMMRFPPNISDEDTKQVKRDLDRLMRASTSWDKAGR